MHLQQNRNHRLQRNSWSVKVLALLSLAFLFPFPLQAETEVKVGYFYAGDNMYKGGDGSYRGYDVEYLYEIARFNDWQYTFVDFDSFEDECRALENGGIDIMPALFYT